tara:strand:- start:3512 stop:4621 length:1110 start_codon:yes stop_codon:yes gene_type:complete
MDSFLREQVSQRASNTDRLSSLISQTKGAQFENWRDDANNLFNSQLNDYSNKASEYIQEKIADTSEGAGVLTQIPHFYDLGTGFYKNVLGERGKGVFDESAKGIKYVKDAVNQKIAQKTGVDIEKTAGDIKTRVSNIADQLEGNTPETSTKLYQYKGVETAETPASEMSPHNSQMLDRSNNPFRTNIEPTQETTPTSSNPQLETRNNLANIQDESPAEIMSRGDISASLSDEERNAIRSADSRLADVEPTPYEDPLSAPTTTATTAAETGAEESGLIATTTELGSSAPALVSGEAALASTGVGAPLAGAIAVAGAITFGLEELLHHSHKPKAPLMPVSANRAIQTPYNISSTILPAGSSLQQMQGAMTF